jgi:hypothetical protein
MVLRVESLIYMTHSMVIWLQVFPLKLEFDTNPVKNSATNARPLDNPEQTFAKTRKRGATAS